MKVTKSYIKQLVIETLQNEGEGMPDPERHEKDDAHLARRAAATGDRDPKNPEFAKGRLQGDLLKALREMVKEGRVTEEIASELMQAVGSRFPKPLSLGKK